MENHRTRIPSWLAAAIVLLVVIGASLIGAAYLRIGQSGTSMTSSSSTPSTSGGFVTTSLASARGTPPGLKLNLQVPTNATGVIPISTNETNLLDRVNNVTTADNWPYPNTDSLPCGNFNQFPIEYAIFHGHYGASNYTSASALTLYDPSNFYACPTEIFPGPYLLFAPLSDNVSRFYSSGQEDSFLASATYSVIGYWTGSGNTSAFQQFPPGTYTVLVEDEWGNVVLLPITVEGS